MPEFDIDPEDINIFELQDHYIFTRHFDNQKIFSQLKDWYNEDRYRFEIPAEDLDQVKKILEDHFFAPVIIDEPTEFIVGESKYSDHKYILRNSVHSWIREDKRFFIMKDKLSVRTAIEKGAEQPESPDLNRIAEGNRP